MRLLLDTHLLLWLAAEPKRLSASASALIEDTQNDLLFSSASLWELTIKHGIGRRQLPVEPRALWKGLIEHGFRELAVTSEHALAVDQLPPIHKDPFDRLLVAQALAEGMMLLTVDSVVAQYPGSIRKV